MQVQVSAKTWHGRPIQLRRRRYLIVDDSPTVRALLHELVLVARPFRPEVVEAGTREEALAALGTGPFDCVFLDMVLPRSGDQGVAVLEAIHARDPGARVVLATGLPREDPAVQEAVMRGAFAHLRKPVHLDALRRAIDLAEEDSGRLRRI